MTELSTGRAIALYVGALLGPSLLLLPGLAAAIAGPASILAWVGLLGLSGLLAWVFSSLGRRWPGRGGAAAYAGAAFGPGAERAVAWCFFAGVVCGAPVVCLMGGAYVAAIFGGGHEATILVAGLLLAAVVAMTLGGARTSTSLQLVLVAVLVVLVAVAVIGSAPHARTGNWHPFAPHGWTAVGGAASVLMLSFVGWEAIAPMTARLRDPGRQLPRIIAAAFAITSVICLALGAATISVLGREAGSRTPVADLLQVAVGRAGSTAAAVAAVVLTLAGTNAYLAGAAEMAAELRRDRRPVAGDRRLQLAVAVVGAALLAATGAGVVTTTQLVTVPTTMFVTVYLGCTAAAVRLLGGAVRVAAGAAVVAVIAMLLFSGWALFLPAGVVGAALVSRYRRSAHLTKSVATMPICSEIRC